MEINKLTNLDVNTELYTNGVEDVLDEISDDEAVESETVKNADYKVSNDSVDEDDSLLDIADEKDKVVAESAEGKGTSSVSSEQTFSENGVVIKYTLNSADAEFSCKVGIGNLTSHIQITAKDCTINVNEAPSNAVLNLSKITKNVTLNSNVQLKGIESRADDSTINGSQYDDNIRLWGDNCTVNAGAGNDTIKNVYGHNVTINGEDGNDTIENHGVESSKVNGGAGDDTITSSGCNSVVDGCDGNDNITAKGKNVEVNGGDGNDNITGKLTKSKINGDAGNDYIVNIASGTIARHTSNPERVEELNARTFNEKTATVIDGGEGEDTIHNLAYDVIINNAEDSDKISIAQPDGAPCGQTYYWQKINTKINYKDGTSIDMTKDDYTAKDNITLDKTSSNASMYLENGVSYEDYIAACNATDCHGWQFNFDLMNKNGISYWYKFNEDGTCNIIVDKGSSGFWSSDKEGYTYVDNSKKT